MTFKVGDKIRRVSNAVPGAPIGFESVVVEPEFDAGVDRVWYVDRDGDSVHGGIEYFELVSDEGPVRTVTRQEIIPGTYDGVVVGAVVDVPDCDNPDAPTVEEVFVSLYGYVDADQLDRAAAVLTALAGALRDEQ